MINKCQKCGKISGSNDYFCTACGLPLFEDLAGKEDQAPIAPPQQTQQPYPQIQPMQDYQQMPPQAPGYFPPPGVPWPGPPYQQPPTKGFHPKAWQLILAGVLAIILVLVAVGGVIGYISSQHKASIKVAPPQGWEVASETDRAKMESQVKKETSASAEITYFFQETAGNGVIVVCSFGSLLLDTIPETKDPAEMEKYIAKEKTSIEKEFSGGEQSLQSIEAVQMAYGGVALQLHATIQGSGSLDYLMFTKNGTAFFALVVKDGTSMASKQLDYLRENISFEEKIPQTSN